MAADCREADDPSALLERMKIALAVNDLKRRAAEAAAALRVAAAREGLEVVEPAAADVLVSLGGDGTFLKAIRDFPALPILGLNVGGLGYLATVEERDFAAALAALAAGRYRIAARTMLAASGDGAKGMALAGEAFNDIVLQRELSGHAAILDFSADLKRPTRYMGDGLVIATPAGSTAYSLSAGGPVVMPDSASFVVTPMNPHALGVRPLVLSDAVTMRVTPRSRPDGRLEKIGVYADGVALGFLGEDETLVLRRAARTARIVELEGSDPYDVLARKLGWSGMNAI